jgi:hypothetical protein
MTKASIVQRLLEEGQITAEEAVVLLSSTDLGHNYHLTPVNPYWPPYNPTVEQPFWYTTSTDNIKPEPFEYPDTKWPGEKNS